MMVKKENSLKYARLGDLAQYINGRAFKPEEWEHSGLPIIRIQNLNKPHAVYNYTTQRFDDKFLVKNGDLLVAWSASLGAYIWKDDDAWLNQHIFKVIEKKEVTTKKYLYYVICNSIAEFYTKAHGSGMVHIKKGVFEDHKVFLPSIPDQHRIVEKIETLFSELDNSVANLKAAKAQLKRYRQSVLKSAFEGKLTAAWREANTDKLETAETLMEWIKAEREAAYASKSRKPKELSPLSADEIADLPELPDGWSFVKLGAVIEEPKYGTSKKCDYETNGVGVLRIPNIANGIIDSEDLKFALFTDDEIEQYRLKSGDLLTIRSNGSVNLVGKTALVLPSDESYLYAGYLIRLRPYQFLADGKYLHYVLASHELRKQIEEKAKSTSGVNNINTGELQSLIIPFVQLDEQLQIVNEIESRLSEADVMERTIEESLIKAEKMRQSILKKAFEGKLVLQDKPVVESTIQVKQLSSTDLHAGIIALTMKLHEGTPHQNKLNHVKCEKIAHLCEALVGIELGRTPVQDAAGPDDYPHLKKVEHRANMVGWFHVCEESIGHTYEKGRKFNALVESVRISLGLKLAEVEKLLQIILPMDLVRAEIFATTYAAWNNLLMDGKQPDHNEIVQSAREEWSSRKMNIDRERFYKAIEWMTKVGIVPMGQGKYVKPMKVKK